MGKRKAYFLKKNDSGQSSVEYILLVGVVVLLSLVVFRSAAFRSFLSGDAPLMATLRDIMQYTYRYGDYAGGEVPGPRVPHPLYEAPTGDSRFATPKEGYGQ